MKKSFLFFAALFVASIVSSCSSPREDAVKGMRSLYEDMSVNSDHYTREEWVAVLEEYAKCDSIIYANEYSPEEQQEINELRGRCAAYLLKGAAKGARSEFDKAVKGVGDFMKGMMDELGKANENQN